MYIVHDICDIPNSDVRCVMIVPRCLYLYPLCIFFDINVFSKACNHYDQHILLLEGAELKFIISSTFGELGIVRINRKTLK